MLPNAFSPEAIQHSINVVPLNFRKDHVPVPGKAGEFREVHRVDLVKKGSNGESTPWSIDALKRETMLWPAIKPFYDRWLAGQEDPVDGTPIDVLPFLTPALVQHLRNLHVRSAEDLAKVTDGDLDRIGMGARMYREKARAYVEAKNGDGRLADALAERDAEVARLNQEVGELKAMVNAMSADRPRRDRPGDMAKGGK